VSGSRRTANGRSPTFLHHVLQRRPKGILAHNADSDGVSGVRKGACRPFDEFCKIVEERRLDLILVERRCLGAQMESGSQQQQQAEHACHVGEVQKRHVIFPNRLR
jgi:hypothetical protein